MLAVVVKSRGLAVSDGALAYWIIGWSSPGLDAAARAVTFLGSSPWTLAVMAMMSVWWWQRGAAERLPVFWGAFIGGLTMQVGLRFAVAQWRPDTAVIPAAGAFIERVDLAGFTSGHAFRAAFLYGWWADAVRAPRARREGWTLAARVACGLLIVAIGLTRVYLQRHWPTDIIGAWLLAAFVLSLVRREHP